MSKVSVIIPVYNVENYLPRCIESVLSQTHTDLEIIIINDESTDSSGEICDAYAKKDRRINIIHQKHGGVSSARNCGLQKCTGEFIVFVDSDDYMAANHIEILLKYKNHDYVTAGYYLQYGNLKWGPLKFPDMEIDIETFRTKPSHFLYKCDTWAPWSKLYKKSIIDQYGLRFDTEVHKGEDVIFNFQYLKHAASLRMVPIGGYYYSYREGSLVHTKHDKYWNGPLKCRKR